MSSRACTRWMEDEEEEAEVTAGLAEDDTGSEEADDSDDAGELDEPELMAHVLGSPAHVVSGSMTQVAEQPSPAAVLPSSHISGASIFPLPQVVDVWQMAGEPSQVKPASAAQMAEQPSPFCRLPSSHCSAVSS